MTKKIRIIDVGPRDGLQNESQNLSVPLRTEFCKKLSDAGVQNIEAGAFVSPSWVPQMKNSNKVINSLLKKQKAGQIKRTTRFSCLVPNRRGLEDALKTDVKEIAVFGAASEAFSKKNINCSIKESVERFRDVIQVAHKKKIKVRGYLSTAFGCPYEGAVSQAKVIGLIEMYLELGVYEVSVGDTIGVATPRQVSSLLEKLEKKRILNKIALHFHDTRGTALANVLKSLEFGIQNFDASLGGLGGCPYAKGASGNLATEDLVYMLHGMGYKTGIDLEKLVKIKKWMENKLNKPLPSRVGQSGLPLQGTIKNI